MNAANILEGEYVTFFRFLKRASGANDDAPYLENGVVIGKTEEINLCFYTNCKEIIDYERF